MKKNFLIIAVLSLLSLSGLLVGPRLVSAQASEAICGGIGAVQGEDGCVDSESTVESTIRVALNILSVIAGIAAVVMIIIAGVRYITSNGESQSVAGAKNALIFAVVGLVIVVLAQSIVAFVLNRVDQQPATPSGNASQGN